MDVAEGDGSGGVVEIAACERELLGVVGGFIRDNCANGRHSNQRLRVLNR